MRLLTILQLAGFAVLTLPTVARTQSADSARVSIHEIEAAEHRWDDLKTDPKVPQLQRANALVREGKLDEAVAQYRSLTKRSNWRALFNLGLVAYQRGDYTNALLWFRASYGGHRDHTCLEYIRNTRRILQERKQSP